MRKNSIRVKLAEASRKELTVENVYAINSLKDPELVVDDCKCRCYYRCSRTEYTSPNRGIISYWVEKTSRTIEKPTNDYCL